MLAPLVVIRSALPGVVWPGITAPDGAIALAMQFQLERSQWLNPATLAELQFRQLATLLRHAWESVPFYRWHWHGSHPPPGELTREWFEGLPLVSRGDLRNAFDALASTRPPPAHGAVTEGRTTGVMGRPARFLTTGLAELWSRALTLRDHLWHRRDFDGTLAVVQPGPEASDAEGWGPATSMIAAAGRSITVDSGASLEAQLERLRRIDPHYLLARPSSVAGLAGLSLASGIRLTRLREVRTAGEPLSADARRLAREAWDVPLTDLYASAGAGCIALQCPAGDHYHVQSECVLVEVLDGRGRACAPGAVGRVVVTTLQNFAMPLVRYEPGDLAEVGAPCDCGRGLPVLRRIAGRTGDAPAVAPGRSAH